jgi:hypothetical protein
MDRGLTWKGDALEARCGKAAPQHTRVGVGVGPLEAHTRGWARLRLTQGRKGHRREHYHQQSPHISCPWWRCSSSEAGRQAQYGAICAPNDEVGHCASTRAVAQRSIEAATVGVIYLKVPGLVTRRFPSRISLR